MAYIDLEYYTSLYGEIFIKDFERLSWDACRKLDAETTGIDGVKKLKVAFPTDEDDAEAVKRCACALVNTMAEIEKAEKSAAAARGYEETEGGMRGKVISSMSAANESISYATSAINSATAIDKAVSNMADRNALFSSIIRDYLSGVTDANGVCLLYMGPYPAR